MELEAALSTYQTRIYCNGNDTCQIDCNSATACYDMELICDSGATCIVNCNSTQGIWCPNNWNNSNINIIQGGLNLFDLNDYINISQETNSFDIFYNDMCDNLTICSNSNILPSYTCSNAFNLTQNLCLTGSYTVDTFGTTSTNGSSSSSINANGYQLVVSATQTMTESNLFNGRYMYCSGYQSCTRDLVTGDDVLTYSFIQDINDTFLACLASETCYCPSTRYHLYIENVKNLYCLGERSCGQLNITVVQNLNIYAFGHATLTGCDIRSGGNGNELNVYLESSWLGHSTVITCQSGDNCTVYCFDPVLSCAKWGITLECDPNSIVCQIIPYGNITDAYYGYGYTSTITQTVETTFAYGANVTNDIGDSTTTNTEFITDSNSDSEATDKATTKSFANGYFLLVLSVFFWCNFW